MSFSNIPSNPFTIPGAAAGFADFRKKASANGGTPGPVITVAVPAYSAGNTTPNPPTVSFDASLRMLTASHSLGVGELEYRHGSSGAVTAYAALAIDNGLHVAAEWQFRVKAASGRNESTWADSPAIAAATTQPGTPAAPTNPTVDDTSNLFDADRVTGFPALSDYEYSMNSGATWTNAVTGGSIVQATGRLSINVGNISRPAGQIRLRVTADSGTSRPSGASATNATDFTAATAPAGGVNIFCDGNSLTQGTWPVLLGPKFPAGYTVYDGGISGRYMGNLILDFQTHVQPQYNPNADYNILFFQEMVNQWNDSNTAPSSYFDMIIQYCNMARAAGWIPIPFTGTPQTTTSGTPYNSKNQSVNGAIRNYTGAAFSHYIDLSLNAKIGAFGTDPQGQDPGYSSYNSAYYPDGFHPGEIPRLVEAQMAYDMVEFIVHGTPRPDPSDYPTELILGEPVQFQNLAYVTTSTDPNGNTNLQNNNAPGYSGMARSVQQLTAGTGSDPTEYRGSFFLTAYTANAGCTGIASQNPGGYFFGWMQLGNLLQGGVYKYGNYYSGIIGLAARQRIEYAIYKDRIEILYDGLVRYTSDFAPIFPCWLGFCVDGASEWLNCRAVIVS